MEGDVAAPFVVKAFDGGFWIFGHHGLLELAHLDAKEKRTVAIDGASAINPIAGSRFA